MGERLFVGTVDDRQFGVKPHDLERGAIDDVGRGQAVDLRVVVGGDLVSKLGSAGARDGLGGPRGPRSS